MKQRIVYLSWPAQEIAGGIKIAFRHVEILRELGFDAIIATKDGEKPTWFETSLEVHRIEEVRQDDDILVFPENHSKLLEQFTAWNNPKVVLFQGLLLGLRGLAGRKCYSDFGVTHLLCAGHQAAEYCRIRFPKLSTTIVPIIVDMNVFRPNSQKRLQIAYIPRKRPAEAAFIIDLFRAIESTDSRVGWVEISRANEKDIAQVLATSALFLSLPRLETCGMTTLEAMASGCLCVGFTGGGGRDFTSARNGLWVEEDDCIRCAHELVRAVEIVRGQTDLYRELVHSGMESANYYRRERLARKLESFWNSFGKSGTVR